MRGFVLNVVLAFVWALLLGYVNLVNLAVGFVIGFAFLSLLPASAADRRYVIRTRAAFAFLAFFLRELTVANVQVALFALSPRPPLHPVIVAVPLHLKHDSAITALAAAITLMPGTVAMGVSPDRKYLYAHAIGPGGLEGARASILKVEARLRAFLE